MPLEDFNDLQTKWLQGEWDPDHSRDEVTIMAAAGNADLKAGTVMSVFTAGADEGEWTIHDPGGANGAQNAAGVLLTDNVVASVAAGDQTAVILTRGPAIVSKDGLRYATGVTAGQQEDAEEELTALGIVVRDAV